MGKLALARSLDSDSNVGELYINRIRRRLLIRQMRNFAQTTTTSSGEDSAVVIRDLDSQPVDGYASARPHLNLHPITASSDSRIEKSCKERAKSHVSGTAVAVTFDKAAADDID